MAASTSQSSPFAPVRPEWLALGLEPVLEPELAIVDCHHHLWTRPECPYGVEELLADMLAGHRVQASVFVECRSHYRAEGDRSLRSLGETEYVADVARKGARKNLKPAAGTVAFVDLQLGAMQVSELLTLHKEKAEGTLRGIRNLSATREPVQINEESKEPSLLMSQAFREGFSQLRAANLVFDAWMFHTQLGDLVDLASTFPDATIILNHLGGPTGVGPQGRTPTAAMQFWQSQIARVAKCENVVLKIGGLGMPHVGFGFHERSAPPTSEDLARAWRPLIECALQAFGTDRAMFESNFPVDKGAYSYVTLWNAFKRLTSGYSRAERERLFSRNASRVYRLDEASAA